MGTRGAFGLYLDKKTKVTYNHSDSYPEELGLSLTKQITEMLGRRSLEELKTLCRSVKLIKDDNDEKPTAEEFSKYSAYLDGSVDSGKSWYALLRHLQGQLDVIIEEAKIMIDSQEFLKDSLFCEWVYIMNLDESVFEVYRGFQHQVHQNGRYASLPPLPSMGGNKYWPVALIKTFPIDENLTNNFENWMKESTEE